jgi:thiamine-monophosphate kinase
MFENNSRTELEHLGEFGLIDHLTKHIQLFQNNTIKGVGDDAAVVDIGDKFQLMSTDMYVEGSHFDLTYTPLKHLGYKSIVANISDIVAMNGKATHILVSLAMSSKFSLEAVEELYAGILAACNHYQVDLVGGDTTSISKGLVINIACYGTVEKNKITYRNGCKEGDLLVVSGDLGAAYLGLHVLEREKRIFMEKPDFQPDLEGNDYIIQRQLKPEASVDIVDLLQKLDVQPTAMIDISDGLASEMYHLAKSSQVGFTIYEDKLPIDPIAYQRAIDFGIDPTTAVLSGGEDYEVLFTISQSDYEKIKGQIELSVIGHAVDKKEGMHLISKANIKHQIKAQGWKAI